MFCHLDAATRSGRYGCTSGPISMHEQSDMGSETRAITDWVTKSKQIVTIFSKTCNNMYLAFFEPQELVFNKNN